MTTSGSTGPGRAPPLPPPRTSRPSAGRRGAAGSAPRRLRPPPTAPRPRDANRVRGSAASHGPARVRSSPVPAGPRGGDHELDRRPRRPVDHLGRWSGDGIQPQRARQGGGVVEARIPDVEREASGLDAGRCPPPAPPTVQDGDDGVTVDEPVGPVTRPTTAPVPAGQAGRGPPLLDALAGQPRPRQLSSGPTVALTPVPPRPQGTKWRRTAVPGPARAVDGPTAACAGTARWMERTPGRPSARSDAGRQADDHRSSAPTLTLYSSITLQFMVRLCPQAHSMMTADGGTAPGRSPPSTLRGRRPPSSCRRACRPGWPGG